MPYVFSPMPHNTNCLLGQSCRSVTLLDLLCRVLMWRIRFNRSPGQRCCEAALPLLGEEKPDVCPHVHFRCPSHSSGSASSLCGSIVRVFYLCTCLPQQSAPMFGGHCSSQHSGRGHRCTVGSHCASCSVHGRVENSTALRVNSAWLCAPCLHVHGMRILSVDLLCAPIHSNIYVHISMWLSTASVEAHLRPCVFIYGFNVVCSSPGCLLCCVVPAPPRIPSIAP